MNTVPRTGASVSLMLPEADEDESYGGFRRRVSLALHGAVNISDSPKSMLVF